MKLISLFSILLPTLFTSFAFAVPNQAILGRWHTVQPIVYPEVVFNLGFSFDYNYVRLTTYCNFRDGVRMSATATSAVRYNVNQINILQRREAVTQDGVRFCRATLDRSYWIAYFDGYGIMYLTLPAPYQQIVLARN